MTIRSIATHSRRVLLAAGLLLLVGCGPTANNLSLNKEGAREACKTFLSTWKSDGKSEQLEPGIIGRDEDWDAGKKLTDFELLTNESDGGANLHIPVRLSLKDAQGRESKVDVVYIVGASPKVTVFRE